MLSFTVHTNICVHVLLKLYVGTELHDLTSSGASVLRNPELPHRFDVADGERFKSAKTSRCPYEVS
jgi:hypothetical protein